MNRRIVLISALAPAATAYAHGPEKGRNGGRQVEAGDHHVELVAKDKTLAVYITDENEKPIDAKGFKATGIFVVGGKAQRIELTPEAANKLSGASGVPLPADLKGAVQVTLPRGGTVQAKFE
ncbi:MAG: hypothetical protein J2P50_07315 [Hyphomicrobiaceae bacterium]|nr:hypothetical protein [Hyphomicrobiaceae bacterium]